MAPPLTVARQRVIMANACSILEAFAFYSNSDASDGAFGTAVRIASARPDRALRRIKGGASCHGLHAPELVRCTVMQLRAQMQASLYTVRTALKRTAFTL